MSEIIDVADGLWVWRIPHPEWTDGHGWDPPVACTSVRSQGVTSVLDPLCPPPEATDIWARIDHDPPDAVIVLKPDHVRDVDLFARRYRAQAFGPRLLFPHDIPRTAMEPIVEGTELPGGLRAVFDGRGQGETPVWCPEQRTLVFADALTAPEPDGVLRVWETPWHEERALPALRELLALPFERVIVSHGVPVHDRAAFERALTLEPHREP